MQRVAVSTLDGSESSRNIISLEAAAAPAEAAAPNYQYNLDVMWATLDKHPKLDLKESKRKSRLHEPKSKSLRRFCGRTWFQ